MKKLEIVLAILGLCIPASAEVLVYKYSASYKLINYTTPGRLTADKPKSEKIQAYIVFNIDSNTPLHRIKTDAGNKPTAILFGKSDTFGKWKKTIGDDDANSSVLINTPASEILGFQTFNNYAVTNSSQERSDVVFTLIDEPNGIKPFEIIADLTGNTKKTGNNLFPTTILLPWSLSGITSVTSGDANTPQFVTGQASSGKAKLDFSEVNSAQSNHWNVAATIADIEKSNKLNGYSPLGPLPIPLP